MTLQDKKIEKKKQDIMQAAIATFIEKGYQKTTLDQVAAALFMTKGSVYYYFQNKQDLLYQCFLLLLNESISNIEEVVQRPLPSTEKLHQAMVVHITYVLGERNKFELLSQEDSYFTEHQLHHIHRMRNDYEQLFDHLLEEGVNDQSFDSVSVKMVRNLILGAMNWMIEWYDDEGEKSLQDFAETAATYLLKLVVSTKKTNGGEQI